MRTGGCQCGELRYESAGEPIALYVCHCRECQKQSASAFGMSLEVPRAGLRVTQGAPHFWTRPADSGRRVKCAFCPHCGSRVWHEREGPAETLTIKGGLARRSRRFLRRDPYLDVAQTAGHGDPGRRSAISAGTGLRPGKKGRSKIWSVIGTN